VIGGSGGLSGATDIGDAEWVREVCAEEPPGAVSGGDGGDHTVDQADGTCPTALPEGRERSSAGGLGADAAPVLFAAVVQPVGPGLEEALYESLVLRRFAGIDLGKEPAPDETTICKFRHLLEEHDLGQAIFAEVNAHLAANGVKIATGTIVDATIIHAPSSTSNEKRERDPEMHQVRKGQQWYFGMKAHVGVDSKSGTVHTAVATAANTSDSRVLPELLHGEERKVWGDGGYQGQGEVIREVAPMAQDMTCRRTKFKHRVDELQRSKNRTKSRVRAKVEHVFRVMKRQFGFDRVRYRGLKKNANRMFACFALVNLYIVRKRLVPAPA
jgi:transposase, IS5 family